MAGGGLKFFPLDCQLDEKFELIEAEFGLKGFAVIVKILQRIYGGEGYYCEWTNEVALLFGKNNGLSESAVSEIVSAAIRRGIFSEKLFDKYQVLTSKGIQNRYLYGNTRKQKVWMKKEYLLLDVDDLRKNVCIFNENVDKTTENVCGFEQTKRNDTKQYNTKRNNDGGDLFTTFEECGFQITSRATEELLALSEEHSEAWVIEAIKRASDRGRRSLSYIKGILNNWQVAGAIDELNQKTRHKLTAEGREVKGDVQIPY